MNKIKRFFKNLIRKILVKLGILEEIQIIIKDDLTGLENFDITVKGIEVIPQATEVIINDKKAKESKLKIQILKFNTPDSHGDIILPEAITFSDLDNLKVSGEILDYQIMSDVIRITKDFKFKDISI